MRYLTIVVKLTLVLLATTVRAQQTTPATSVATPANGLECQVLTGRITDPFANPLTGATIMLRSPNKGFTPEAFGTNSEGHYIITLKQAIPQNTIMEITAVGYLTMQLTLTNCRPLDLTLTPVASTTYKFKSRTKKLNTNSKIR
ncbi:hypothetical protein GCM10022409_46100 [Hymenobacter glaciei]|uniref:TonB-dependent receptor plug domain-containing protein n=1 Tax=Hymenobacter glaciei TaxID=877209 RepID=A0ABP7UXP6_9BACT